LRRGRVDASGSFRLPRILMNAELDAVVCSGGRRGKHFTYALLEERVPPARPLDRDETLLELSRRYFTTRGPATPNDFAWWSGLTVADARRGIGMMGDELEREMIDGRAYWSVPSTVKRWRAPMVHLLPNYDELFIGHKDRSALGRRLASVDLVTGGDALTAYVVVVDGQLVGGWKRAPTAKAVAIELKLLVRLSAAERAALGAAARRYAAFLGAAVEVLPASSLVSFSRKRPRTA
ncbi:MAG: winged helix DNA-binding domain-containing protein, partial [Gemmatimonadota bacterium]|nr:winged helix DNA-binding domain-containing protein [Gemmatimonadota bacterium]